MKNNKILQSAGLGLRSEHFTHILENKPDVAWFEVLIDNFIDKNQSHIDFLDFIANNYPIAFHSVSLNIGSTDSFNWEHLSKIKDLCDKYNPAWLSDHLCWMTSQNMHSHDLLPLPYNRESLAHVCRRIDELQNFFGRELLIENISSYVDFEMSTHTEWNFYQEIAHKSSSKLLLDVNNVYVNSHNFEFDPKVFIDTIDASLIKQIHLSGHDNQGQLIVDSHGSKIVDDVWELFKHTIKSKGPIPTLIEWDKDVPEFEVVNAEAIKAQSIMDRFRN